MSTKKKDTNYFDKFIDDQLTREAKNQERRSERIVETDKDLKRQLLQRYRERVSHLIRRKK